MAFFIIDREVLNSWIWEDKEFSKGQAYADIIAKANYADKTRIYRNKVIPIKRGQLPTSKLALSRRWGWEEGKVDRFLKHLELDGYIKVESTKFGTTITVLNYGVAGTDKNAVQTEGETEGGTVGTDSTATGTTNGGTDTGTNQGTQSIDFTSVTKDWRGTDTGTGRRKGDQPNGTQMGEKTQEQARNRRRHNKKEKKEKKEKYIESARSATYTPKGGGVSLSAFYFDALVGEYEEKGGTREQVQAAMERAGVTIGDRTDDSAVKRLRRELDKIEGNRDGSY